MAYTQNYYQILGLHAPGPGSPAASCQPKSAELRRAYRVALLAAHPDKNKADRQKAIYSVDDVREAFAVLDDGAQRRGYDNWILRNPHIFSSAFSSPFPSAGVPGAHPTTKPNTQSDNDFLLGLELLDLSDFSEHEQSCTTSTGGEEQQLAWTRECRCGDDEGFRIKEEELVDAEGRGEKEVLVGCGGCSLWVRVGFEVEEG